MDRYGKTEMEDNWMLEEAKKQIQLWPFLYGLLALLLVVMNPLSAWILNKITPVAGQYYKTWGLLLFLFLCAYGMVCFLSLLREKKEKAFSEPASPSPSQPDDPCIIGLLCP